MMPSTNSDDATDAEFEHVNLLVTSGPLVPSLVKCLFFRLDNMITCNNGLFFLSLLLKKASYIIFI